MEKKENARNYERSDQKKQLIMATINGDMKPTWV